MAGLRTGQIERLEAVQELHMDDTCQILTRSATTDSYGLPVEAFTAGDPVKCGLKIGSRAEVHEAGQVVLADAELRLPIGTAITTLDRVQVTHRYGRELASAWVYNVIGQPAEGPSGLLVTMERVTDE